MSISTTPTALVTGAYGYLGSLLRSRLARAGWETIALVRRPRPGDRAVRWSLGERPSNEVLQGVDALVHCAYDFTPRSRHAIWSVNVDGSDLLLRSAASAGVGRILALSSMSAYTGTSQIYGQAKLALERTVLELGGVAVRPGLVYGDAPSGMAGALVKLMRLPLVPLIGGGARQFPVHEDDLARLILEVLESESWNSEVFGIAQPTPVSFKSLLVALSSQRSYQFVPIPWQLVYWSLRLAELMRLPLPLRADSVLGLVRPAPSVPRSRTFPHQLESIRALIGPPPAAKP